MRLRLSYANVVSSLALFISLGGISYAAIKLPARSVGNAQLRDRAVSNRTLDASIRRKLRDTAAPGPAGRDGAPGPAGPVGAPGPAGPPGSIDGVQAGGDLTDAFPSPRIAADAVTSPKVAPDALTGTDIQESSLAKVPFAAKADEIFGIERADLVRGGGRLLGDMAFAHTPYTPLAGTHADLSTGYLGGADLHFQIMCSNGHPSYGTNARPVVLNGSNGPAWLWIDDGVNPIVFATVAGGNGIWRGAPFTEETRRFVFQGVGSSGMFFMSVVASEHSGTCRAGGVGHTT